MFGEHQYHFNDDNKSLTFIEAEKVCKNEGGTSPILARKMDKSAIRFLYDRYKVYFTITLTNITRRLDRILKIKV